jgi:hypothetical protein
MLFRCLFSGRYPVMGLHATVYLSTFTTSFQDEQHDRYCKFIYMDKDHYCNQLQGMPDIELAHDRILDFHMDLSSRVENLLIILCLSHFRAYSQIILQLWVLCLTSPQYVYPMYL